MVDLPTQVMILDQMYGVKEKPYSGRVYACIMYFVFCANYICSLHVVT